MNDLYRCIELRIYGPCSSEFCGGVCDDTWGTCKHDEACLCQEQYADPPGGAQP